MFVFREGISFWFTDGTTMVYGVMVGALFRVVHLKDGVALQTIVGCKDERIKGEVVNGNVTGCLVTSK